MSRFRIDFGWIFGRFWSRFGGAGVPFCSANKRIWSTWADLRMKWDWIRIWTGFWAQVGPESECPNQNIRLRMSESTCPNQNIRLRMSESNFDRFWSRFESDGSRRDGHRARRVQPPGPRDKPVWEPLWRILGTLLNHLKIPLAQNRY